MSKPTETPDRISVEIRKGGGLLALGTVPAFRVVSGAETGDLSNVHVSFRRRSGRIIGVICECASDARRLPGFEPLPKP